METETLIRNERIHAFSTGDGISFVDLKDQYNDYRGFTRNTRGLPKAIAYIKGLAPAVKNTIGMGDMVKLLTEFNLKPHTYCGMD